MGVSKNWKKVVDGIKVIVMQKKVFARVHDFLYFCQHIFKMQYEILLAYCIIQRALNRVCVGERD